MSLKGYIQFLKNKTPTARTPNYPTLCVRGVGTMAPAPPIAAMVYCSPYRVRAHSPHLPISRGLCSPTPNSPTTKKVLSTLNLPVRKGGGCLSSEPLVLIRNTCASIGQVINPLMPKQTVVLQKKGLSLSRSLGHSYGWVVCGEKCRRGRLGSCKNTRFSLHGTCLNSRDR